MQMSPQIRRILILGILLAVLIVASCGAALGAGIVIEATEDLRLVTSESGTTTALMQAAFGFGGIVLILLILIGFAVFFFTRRIEW